MFIPIKSTFIKKQLIIMNILLFPRVILKTGVGVYVKQLTEELCVQGNKVFLVYAQNDLGLLPPNGGGIILI